LSVLSSSGLNALFGSPPVQPPAIANTALPLTRAAVVRQIQALAESVTRAGAAVAAGAIPDASLVALSDLVAAALDALADHFPG
jgi:hypothetical protein